MSATDNRDGEFPGKRGLVSFLQDLILPNCCPFCGRLIPYDETICTGCRGDILWADEHICRRCGKDECMCGGGQLFYDGCFPAAYYAGAAREGVLSLKYDHLRSVMEIFGTVMRDMLEEAECIDGNTVIIPVPMSRTEVSRRGGNQAELLARVIAGNDIPIEARLLRRRYNRTAQHELSGTERVAAVNEQYYAAKGSEGSLNGRTVIICDDVLTTGSTVNRCAELAKELGAAKAFVTVCATTSRNIE